MERYRVLGESHTTTNTAKLRVGVLVHAQTTELQHGDNEDGVDGANNMQVHGWPDLSLGWRYQIPLLVNLGFRVVVPDMMGYGGTVSFQLLHVHRCVLRQRRHVS